MKFIKIVSISLIFLSSTILFGQRNFTLYHLEGTPQTHYLNPSFRPSSTVNVSLPLGMQSVGVSSSAFALNDLIQEREQDDSLEIRLDAVIDLMNDLNHFNIDVQNEILGVGFRLDDNYFSLGIVNRLQFNFLYPRDLIKLAYEGNGDSFLGERASFDGLGVNLNSYVEYGIGYNRIIADNLMVGGRVKFLSGIANLRTTRSVFGVHTDSETFDITIDGSARINTSNISPLISFEDEDEENGNNENDDFSPHVYAYNFNNFGMGLDLGASYVVNDKLLISASMNDLGFINWSSNTHNFETNEIDFAYRGVNFGGFLEDSLDVFEQLADTMRTVFSGTDNREAYSTSLYTRFFIGGRYQVTEKIGATALLYNEIVNGRYRAGFHVGANLKLGQWLSACLNYGYYGRSWTNIGAGLSLRGGPVQFFVGMDNMIAAISPESQRNFHLTTGLTLMFGKPDKQKEPGVMKFK